MTAPVVDFAHKRFTRDVRTIALALAVRETIHSDPEDPTPMAESLREMLVEFETEPLEGHENDYRLEIAAEVVRPIGAPVSWELIHADIDPAVHDQVARRAREYLTRIGRDFGVPLMEVANRP